VVQDRFLVPHVLAEAHHPVIHLLLVDHLLAAVALVAAAVVVDPLLVAAALVVVEIAVALVAVVDQWLHLTFQNSSTLIR
jgi:hypothetical protein